MIYFPLYYTRPMTVLVMAYKQGSFFFFFFFILLLVDFILHSVRKYSYSQMFHTHMQYAVI